jgi:AraC-like DNA-binding protein
MSTLGLLKEPFYISCFRNANGKVVGRLLTTISLDSFESTIASIDVTFACLYADDFIIPSKTLPVSYTAADLSSEQSVSQLLSESVKCFYIKGNNYTYLIALSSKDYYAPLIWMIVCFIIYILLVFILDYLYLFRVSKARYKEISSLVQALPQENATQSPSYREIVPAVQNALLNASDLREKQQEVTKAYMIHDLIHRPCKPAVLQNYAQELGIPDSGTFYCLALFHIRESDNIALETSSSEDSHQMIWTIFKTVSAQFEDDTVRIVCDYDTDSFHALFIGDLPNHPTCAEAISEQICKFIHSEYGILFHSSVSNSTKELSDIPTLLTQVQKLDHFSQSINSSSPVISENLLRESSASFITGNFFRQQMTLANTLLSKKYNVIPALVASILEEHVTNNPDYDLAINRLLAVAETLAEAVLAVKGIDLNLQLYAKRLRDSLTVDMLNKETESIFLQLDSVLNAAPTSFFEVDQACIYIKENLADANLNVTMISEAVGTIPQRLIPMFQKQLDMGIAEYVNYQRIEEATKLLTDTKMKVRQISDAVGYCNTDTFTRNFRKLRGTTPTEYRQLFMQ